MDDESIGLEISEMEHANASFLAAPASSTAEEAPHKPVHAPVMTSANPLPAVSTPIATAPTLPVATSATEENLRVSYHCKAKKCFRLQWEAEMNPRCPRQTTIMIENAVYIFDGFYLLCHSDPPEVPRFEYSRGGVMCKVHFIPEDLPSSVRGMTSNDVDPDREGHRSFCDSLVLLQRYVFQQLLGIQPTHLFGKVFPDPEHATGDASEICGDYHLVPRFIAVNEEPLLHVEDLHSPNRVGYAVGHLLSVQRVLEYLETSAKFTVRDFLMQFDHRELVDCVISTRINGQPSVFRVDEVVMEPRVSEDGNPSPAEKHGVVTKDGQNVVCAIIHRSEGARNYDGAKSKKRIRKWQEQGAFLQLSPEVKPLSQELLLAECHLTGIRTDLFEVGSAMPMVLKYVRHFNLLTSFEDAMGLKFKDKALLRQAFTHGSYIDMGMQNVNTVEATRSRVRLGHVFENVASLKRSRSVLLDGDTPMPGKAAGNNTSQLRQVAEKHLSGDFKEEFHSRYLCPYERLEFLGDAVLGFLVASSAFLKLPTADEGFLHQTRVDIVNNDNLGKMAKTANFESLLLSAFDLTKLDEQIKAKITADCFEALLGALYKDQGIVPCRALLGKLMDLHDPELRELCYLSTEELLVEAKAFVEKDRAAIKKWSKYTNTRLLHRRFAARSGVNIANTHLWLHAFTHASFQKPQIDDDEFIGHDPSYERIEFLGDAVLQLLSSEFLVEAFPYHQEHLLTQVRSSLVKNKKLAIVARKAGYEEFIRLGNLVKQNGNLYVEDVLADVFEATLGAVYMENPGDLGKVRSILEKLLFPRLTDAIRRRQWMNPRKVFMHYITQWSRSSMRQIPCQFKNIKVPSTNTEASVLVPKDKNANAVNGKSKKAKTNDPPGHAVALYVNNFQVSRAVGRTISAAQDAACMKALTLYGVKLHED
ncbi:RNA helicase/RNAse III [Phytophthora palmivora]|uniref:RNA helicase/RNAse III n=1 Tax=Phytophthora palmivora TaxID=4796 RepID=A0A2P4WZM0_9STRA|nr:RNA helicase/RNAse III [Phytophthora palmivora]